MVNPSYPMANCFYSPKGPIKQLVISPESVLELKGGDEGFDSIISLRELEKDDLKEIGITKLGHRKAIIKAITAITALYVPQ